MKCKKCGHKLSGKQSSYCSIKCSRRHLKSQWQKRSRDIVNKAKSLWRKRTNRISDKCWYYKAKEKSKAQRLLNSAKKKGLIIAKPCSICGSTNKIQAHHPDYSKPLEVIWLCAQHHVDEHQKIK